jgi:RNA polymerase sigma-70 factor, ECF subfamily
VDQAADQLIRARLRNGDPSALDLIYDRYAGMLYNYLRGMIGGNAEDVLQEIFVSIAECPARVANADNLPGYLIRMARNRALDALRKAPVSGGSIGEIEQRAPEPTADTDSVARAVRALPTEQREVVSLKIWQDLTFVEIAELLDIPLDTAASRYRYALQKLRSLLKDDHGR